MCPSIHKDLFRDIPFYQTKLIVTARGLHAEKKTRQALRSILPYARIRKVGFRSVYLIETHGNVINIADNICHKCIREIGHTTAVVEEVPTDIENIKEAAVSVGSQLVNENRSYCVRVKKRGSYLMDTNIQKLEAEIGSGIWDILEEKYGKEPVVDLEDPDVTIVAEVLGHMTAIGIQLKSWYEEPKEEELNDSQSIPNGV